MLLMTLKGIKRMLDKAAGPEMTVNVVSVENARDMLEELIKELEKKPEVLPKPNVEDPELESVKREILG